MIYVKNNDIIRMKLGDNVKYTKKVKSLNYGIIGFILMIVGILAVWKKSGIISFLFIVLGIMLLWDGCTCILNIISNHEKHKTPFIQVCTKIILAIIFLFYRFVPMSIITILFACYMLVNAIINGINCYLYHKSNSKGMIRYFISTIFYSFFGISLLLSPFWKLDTVMLLIGMYCILLSLTFYQDAIHIGVPEEIKHRTKRKVRISLPVAVVAILPKLTLEKINAYLEDEPSFEIDEKKEDQLPDMQVYVHAGTSGFGAIGHLDLSFEGVAISYGNYDASSTKLFDAIGDGVLFCAPLEPYLPFCIDHEENNIFAFGLRLNEEEKALIRQAIAHIMEQTIPWAPPIMQHHDELHPEKYDDFPSQLYANTKAELFKFKKGKFKTYFVLGTNCVLLADSVIGKLGTDILNMRGLISPGTYLDYLQREYTRKDSRVISSHVYLCKKSKEVTK